MNSEHEKLNKLKNGKSEEYKFDICGIKINKFIIIITTLITSIFIYIRY